MERYVYSRSLFYRYGNYVHHILTVSTLCTLQAVTTHYSCGRTQWWMSACGQYVVCLCVCVCVCTCVCVCVCGKYQILVSHRNIMQLCSIPRSMSSEGVGSYRNHRYSQQYSCCIIYSRVSLCVHVRAEIAYFYVSGCCSIRPLILIVKHWAKQRGIDDSSNGSLSS